MSDRPEREPLESALAGLKPAPALLDRDRVMFAAGQASATPARRWVWPGAPAAPRGRDYLQLRRRVLRCGVEPRPAAPPLSPGGKMLSIDSIIEPPKKRS